MLREEYFEYLSTVRCRSHNTIVGYRYTLNFYYKFCEEMELAPLEEKTAWQFFRYLGTVYKNKNTIQLKQTILKSYSDYLRQFHKIIFIDPDFKPISGSKKIINPPRAYEIMDILGKINKKPFYGHRVYFIILFLFGTGLRVSELVNLQISHIQEDKVIVRNGKGGKDRIVYMPKIVHLAYLEYLKRFEKEIKRHGYIIFTHLGRPCTTRAVQNVFAEVRKQFKIEKTFTPHSLRHALATEILNNGCNIRYIQELLGHSSIVTTQRYTKVFSESLRKAHHDAFSSVV